MCEGDFLILVGSIAPSEKLLKFLYEYSRLKEFAAMFKR